MFKQLHIIGIGGIGMSALAEVARHRGIAVQGSDPSSNANIERLARQGIKIFPNHDSAHLTGVDCVVYSSAIGEDNPELVAAREQGLRLWHRAELLAWLMEGKQTITISGTHGKTTTTALIGAVLVEAGLDPTIINGGIMAAWQSNARLGKSDWLVVEGDESDNTFTQLPTDIAVITNIDKEHLAHYGSYEGLLDAFQLFIKQARKVAFVPATLPFKSPSSARPYSEEVTEKTFSADQSQFCVGGVTFTLPLLGEHNIENALAALAVARALKIDDAVTQRAFASFSGVARRYTLLGEKAQVRFYDDYAHHPKEIAATLSAAKKAKASGRVIALLQPHRYSRLEALFDDFVSCLKDADEIWLCPVYTAGEAKQKRDSQDLRAALEKAQHSVTWVEDVTQLKQLIGEEAKAGDSIIALGAGSVGAWLKEAITKGGGA